MNCKKLFRRWVFCFLSLTTEKATLLDDEEDDVRNITASTTYPNPNQTERIEFTVFAVVKCCDPSPGGSAEELGSVKLQ